MTVSLASISNKVSPGNRQIGGSLAPVYRAGVDRRGVATVPRRCSWRTQGAAPGRVESRFTCLGHASAVARGAALPRRVAVAPARRRARASRSHATLIAGLEQRHLDLIGLGLVAAGVYLGCVLYVGWDGGPVGEWLKSALENVAGRIAYVVPLALAGWGMALVMRPFVAAPGALNAGAVLLLASLLLAFAAADRRAGARPSRPPRLLRAALLHRPRGGCRRGPLLGGDDALPAARGPDPGRPDVRQRPAAADRDHGREPAVRRRAGRAHRRRRHPRAGEDGALWRQGLEGVDPAARRSRSRAPARPSRSPTEIAGRRAGDGGDARPRVRPMTSDARVGRRRRSRLPTAGSSPTRSRRRTRPTARPTRSAPETRRDEQPAATSPRWATGEARSPSPTRSTTRCPPPKLLQRGKGDPGPGHAGPRGRRQGAAGGAPPLRRRGEAARGGQRPSREPLRAPARARAPRSPRSPSFATTSPTRSPPPTSASWRRSPARRRSAWRCPNQRRRLVRLGDIYDGRPKGSSPLAVWLGKDVSGQAVWADLAPMPHALVAGTTGSGKSGCINAMLCSVLLHASPNEARLVLVDPKRVELNHYERLPHLLTPVVTNPRLAANVLANLIGEMESRYARHGRGEGAQPGRAQPGPSQGRRGAAAAHPLRDRRAGRPDDGRARGGRGLDHPAGAEVAGRRHPPGAGDPATVDRRDHGDDQGQHPGPDRVLGRLAGRLPRDPRPGRRRDPARPGRHAVSAGRDLEAAAPPGGVRDRGRDRPPGRPLGAPGRARVRRGAARGRARGRATSATTSCRRTTTTCSTRRRGSWSRARPRPSR